MENTLQRYRIIAPHLTDGVPINRIARAHNLARHTVARWINRYKHHGLGGLERNKRRDKGQKVEPELRKLIEGFCLRRPALSLANIRRKVQEICVANGWSTPSYYAVRSIAQAIPIDLRTLAHEGEKAYKQAFDIIHRREAEHANEIWQCDHTPLDILVLDNDGQAKKPVLTAIIDDFSRAVPGYYLAFEPPNSVRVALALRQGIWHKEEQSWSICGIPERFYTDHGSDFMSHHIEQVSVDLKFELIQSLPGQPQGRGKIERFFQTVTELFISAQPGYAPGAAKVEASLTIEELDRRFKKWLVEDYMQRLHSETGTTPKDRWESFAFLPRMPDGREQLDLLLLTIAKTRKIQRDGIRFQGFRYFDINLSGYVGEEVTIRYDPRDLAEIFVYADNEFICRAVCAELADKTVSIKEIIKARNHRKKELKQNLNNLLAIAEKHAPTKIIMPTKNPEPVPIYPKFKIRLFACDE